MKTTSGAQHVHYLSRCYAQEQMLDLLDDEPGALEASLLRRHLCGCEACEARMLSVMRLEMLADLALNDNQEQPAVGPGGSRHGA